MLKRRLGVAAGIFVLWAVAIEARLFHLQVIRHAELTARAERQQNRTVTAFAKRGDILDRNGQLLAFSVDADTIYAVPTEIQNPSRVSSVICGALGDCSANERRTLTERL